MTDPSLNEPMSEQKLFAAIIKKIGALREKIKESGASSDMGALSQDLQAIEIDVQKLSATHKDSALDVAGGIGELLEHIKKLETKLLALSSPPRGRVTFIRFVRMEKVKNDEVPLIEVKDIRGRYAFVYFMAEDVDYKTLQYGQQLVVSGVGEANHALEVLDECSFSGVTGTILRILESDTEGARALFSHTDSKESVVVRPIKGIDWDMVKEGIEVLVDPEIGFIFEVLPPVERKENLVTEIPTVTFDDIGGLKEVKYEIQEELSAQILFPEVNAQLGIPSPKGFILDGGPGVGKTMIAKASINFLADLLSKQLGADVKGHFISIKGPELLTKWVGETERLLRELFEQARAKASPTSPVIIFFDEADAFLRARGRAISSDVHETHVPMFNVLVDGLEEVNNIILILATNRRDLLDPAVIRPGRFDKIFTIPAPDEDAVREILGIYLKPEHVHPKYNVSVYVPTDRHGKSRRDKKGKEIRHKFNKKLTAARDYLVNAVVARMYSKEDPRNVFLRITFKTGNRPPLVFRYSDFASGARIKNIVDRAKKSARRRYIKDPQNEPIGVMLLDLYSAVEEVFAEFKTPSARGELLNWLATEGHMQHIIDGEADIELSPKGVTMGEDAG